MTKARQGRDMMDTYTLQTYFKTRNPFSSDQSLRNIDNGVIAADNVIDTPKDVGEKIQSLWLDTQL